MPVVDVHTHVFPDDIAARAVSSLAEAAGLKPYLDGTVKGLLASMDRSGVTMSVLCPIATKPEQVESINTWTASAAGPRLVPFGTMHPAYPDPEAEVERMVALGIKGIKLHPEFQSFAPDDPRMSRLYRAAAHHNLPVLFHAGEDPHFEQVRGVPHLFKQVLADFPELTVILAHLGGFRVWDEVTRHLLGERVYLDTAYTFGHLPEDRVAEIVLGHGTDRVLFGSDAPWTDAGVELEYLRALGLSADDLEAILWRNASELLELDL